MIGPTARTHYDWSGFQGQGGNERCLLLQLEGNASVPLPRDFFATASDFEAAAAFAREKILVPAPPPSPPLVAWKRIGWGLVYMVLFIIAVLVYLTMTS